MKNFTLAVIAAVGVATAVPAVAQAWAPIQTRQSNLYNRIEEGIRNGALTRGEANSLRTRFGNLVRMESRYRSGGLTRYERTDLQRRYDALSNSIRNKRNNNRDRRR